VGARAANQRAPLSFELSLDHYPYWCRVIADNRLAIHQVDVLARTAQSSLTVYATSTSTGDPLSRDGRLLATTLSSGEDPDRS
jgi:hypothetical protein